jgi:cell wall-associated NlpC family hydrolase
MERKRFIAISALALVMTGSSAAYGALTETGVFASGTEEVSVQLVTKPAEIINSPVKKEVVLAGPVTSPEIASGPVLRSDAPIVGSYDWMAQEKAAKDKLIEDAEQKQRELETEAARVQAELEARIAELENIVSNTRILNETLVLVKNQVGRTPYVFSGSTPRGWDCSGLVRWTYGHLGIDLRHSANTQRDSGTIVTEPKIGDIVSFNYKGSRSAYHSGIYLGPDEMIHSGGKAGDRTSIISISGWAKDNNNSEIVYTRIIETNN